nr:MAG TPA: hypothetical protein [Caudoviricetes sp.]
MMSREKRPGFVWHQRQRRAEIVRRGESDA